MTTECPKERQLRAFAIGELVPEQVDQIAAHIDGCTDCEMALEQYDQTEDLLLEDIKVASSYLLTSENDKPIQVPERLVQLARDADGSGGSNRKLPLDAGKRLADQLETGPCFLGRFRLTAELGVGAYGYVFRAEDTELRRTVAIKVQRAGSFATDQEIDRFLNEARTIANLKHPGIVALYDSVKTQDDICYLVTEFVEGESLDKVLQSTEWSTRDGAKLVAQIADALGYAHQHGVIHRDVKPSNILIAPDGNPHLMDFGLAKFDLSETLTSDGQVMGTPAYMSPEQMAGQSHHVDARSDLFSLGVVLYELITGRPPFQGNRRSLMLQILELDPLPPRRINPSVPRDLETICLKCLAKNPDRRYSSASELAADLRRFLDGEPILARRAGLLEQTWRWCTHYPLAASLMVAAPVALMVGLIYLTWLSAYLVRQTALESARLEADMLEEINSYYSEEVVGRLDWKKIKVTHQYESIEQSLPLPFTFMIDATNRITEKKGGMKVHLYSRNPWRSEGGPKDEFEDLAISKLQTQTSALESGQLPPSFHQFMEGPQGPTLRYARAQIMQESCVKCHNEHEQSPKRDWKEGDLAGVLALDRPLQRDIEKTRAGLRSAFYVVGITAASLMFASLVGIWGSKRRRGIGISATGNRNFK